MANLIKIKVENDQQLVSARELHKGLELTTRFSKWVDQNFKDFELGSDFMSVTTVTDMPNGGTKQIQDYALTIDMAKQLCLLSRTKKGKEYREYLIQVEKNWNNPDMIVQRALAIQNSKVQLLEHKNKLHEDKKKEYSIMISNFASDLKHGVIKSESQFNAIVELCDEYIKNGWNGKIKLDSMFIQEEYIRFANKVKNGDFVIKGGK